MMLGWWLPQLQAAAICDSLQLGVAGADGVLGTQAYENALGVGDCMPAAHAWRLCLPNHVADRDRV